MLLKTINEITQDLYDFTTVNEGDRNFTASPTIKQSNINGKFW